MTDLLRQAMDALRNSAPDGFFVGGCVRDWLLGRPLKDLDLALAAPVDSIGREAARALGGVFFWLREGMGVGRIIVKNEPPLQIDLVPLAGTLEEDLRRRDFTINAMAVSASEGLAPGAAILDPTGGRVDLDHRRLRLAAPDALERDPLRCLRAFRLRARLGLTFMPGLDAAIRAAAPSLAGISGERIRDELFVLLEEEDSASVVAELLAQGLVRPWSSALAASAAGDSPAPAIEPSPDGEEPAASTSRVAVPAPRVPSGVTLLSALDSWLIALPLSPQRVADLEATLDACVTPPRARRALARLAALSIGAGAAARTIGRNLCLSEDEVRVLARAVEGAQALPAVTLSAGSDRLRFFQRWEPGAAEAVLLELASRPSSSSAAESSADRERNARLLDLLGDVLERRLRPVRPLLTGDEVMAVCQLTPGPSVGRWLRAVEEARANEQLHSTAEAREWLQRQCEPESRREAP